MKLVLRSEANRKQIEIRILLSTPLTDLKTSAARARGAGFVSNKNARPALLAHGRGWPFSRGIVGWNEANSDERTSEQTDRRLNINGQAGRQAEQQQRRVGSKRL